MYELTAHDRLVEEYHNTGDSTRLVGTFQNFLNKYATMLWNDNVDYRNYDLRCFLACFIKDKDCRIRLRRGKFHSFDTRKRAEKVLQYLRFKLRNHSRDEIQAELVIPFLRCAQMYRSKGKSFEKYLYVAYRYTLKRHFDNIHLDVIDSHGILYGNLAEHEEEWEAEWEEKPALAIEFDAGMELNDPAWIRGDKGACNPLFAELKPHERFIMAKYYYEELTDKDIARLLPYHPKSIARIRMRIKRQFQQLYNEGEIKWIRLLQSNCKNPLWQSYAKTEGIILVSSTLNQSAL